MPSYYPNPYAINYPISYGGGNWYWNPVNPQVVQQPTQQAPQQTYMINVDGENAAKAWQPVSISQPNTIIPLFDSDGQHVYFKTFDAYGRMNPIRKGRIVFDDEVVQTEEAPAVDMSGYATSEDINNLKEQINSILSMLQKPTNQNGSNSRGGEKK